MPKRSVWFPDNLDEFLREKAKRDDCSISSIVQDAVRNHMGHDPVGIEMRMQELKEQEEDLTEKKEALKKRYEEAKEQEQRVQEAKKKVRERGVIP